MAFEICGAHSNTQTVQQALDAVPPLRLFFQVGGFGKHCKTSSGVNSVSPKHQWFTARAETAGSFSAICLLTAQRLFEDLEGKVPVGAIESCIGGTYVEPWTPPAGNLWQQHMAPLVPMNFGLAIWDQGEADAKRTNSTWYAEEFPRMIQGWRTDFQVPNMPFFYVELCTEYGASLPHEDDFWLAQRKALELPAVGFAVTTDLQRTLHPPDKQDVAERLALEIRRMVYGEDIVSRGPELVSSKAAGDSVTFTFTNSSLATGAGLFVGDAKTCESTSGHNSMASDPFAGNVSLNYSISGATVTVQCASSSGLVRINADYATCFLYGPAGLPAPPVQASCAPKEWLLV